MTFLQMIEYETDRPADVDATLDRWIAATEGKRTASHEMHTQDRENPAHFVDLVEFPSYEKAMENDKLPETQRIAAELRELCTAEPRFVNLDVRRDELL